MAESSKSSGPRREMLDFIKNESLNLSELTKMKLRSNETNTFDFSDLGDTRLATDVENDTKFEDDIFTKTLLARTV